MGQRQKIEFAPIKTTLTPCISRTQKCEQQWEELESKVEDLENYSQSSCCVSTGGKGKNNLCLFPKKLLLEALGAAAFGGSLLIKQDHRLGKPSQADANESQSLTWPRVVMMKILNYTDKIRIIRTTRLKGPILPDSQKVLFFPIISVNLLKQRKAFEPVRKDLASLSIPALRYGIVQPAKLVITN